MEYQVIQFHCFVNQEAPCGTDSSKIFDRFWKISQKWYNA